MNYDILKLLDNQGFKQICNSEEKVLDFVHKIKHRDHCVLIFVNENIRDVIVKEFVNPKYARNSISACFTHNESKYNCDHQMTYDKLVKGQKFQPEVISDFLVTVLENSYKKDSTRIACEDTAWLAEGGFFEEHQKYGNSMDKRVLNDSAMICCYNAEKLNEEQMNIITSNQKLIILEEPFSVYQKLI